jgi:hypothetical protein
MDIEKEIADFRDYRESLGLSPATLNGDVTILCAAFTPRGMADFESALSKTVQSILSNEPT